MEWGWLPGHLNLDKFGLYAAIVEVVYSDTDSSFTTEYQLFSSSSFPIF